MLTAERRQKLHTIIRDQNSVTVAEMASYFDVSTETIRRDFEAMSKDGKIVKTYGGAIYNNRVAKSVAYPYRVDVLVEAKRAMANAAAKHINPGESIFLDHSTTVFYMCDAVKDMDLTVLTNSVAVQQTLINYPNIHLVSTGGIFNPNEYGYFGSIAVNTLTQYFVDKAFLSCTALDMEKGYCDSSDDLSNLRRQALYACSGSSYMLVDHTKFNKVSFVHTSNLGNIPNLITDTAPSSRWMDALQRAHVNLTVTESNP